MPAPVVSRKNSVIYGAFEVGGATDYQLHSVTSSEGDYGSLTVSFQVFVQHDSVPSFNTLCTALEAAYRIPNLALQVTVGGSSWYNLSQSGNTGMLARPSFSKDGGGGDSNNTRVYDCSIRVMRAADEPGLSGRRASDVTYTEDGAEVLHLDVSASYTALGNNAALAQAKSAFPTYLDTLKTAGGGTWDETASLTYTHDSYNKVCQCSASFRQLLVDQSQSATNDAELFGVTTSVSTSHVGIGADPGGSAPLIKISVSFACSVRSSVSKDLRSIYQTKARPHMIAIAEKYADDAQRMVAIVDAPGLSPESNSMRSRMVFLAPGKSNLIRADTNVAMLEAKPFFFEPVLDGGDYSRDRHAKPGYAVAAVATTLLLLGSGPGDVTPNMYATADAHVARLKKLSYHVVQRQEPVLKVIEFDGMGLGGAQLQMLSVRRTILMEKAIIRTVSSKGTRFKSQVRGGAGGREFYSAGDWIK